MLILPLMYTCNGHLCAFRRDGPCYSFIASFLVMCVFSIRNGLYLLALFVSHGIIVFTATNM